MKLYVQILDDDGKVLVEHSADPCQPSMWRAPSGQKLTGKMPQNSSDVANTGTYELHGITFQPHVRVDRPNGYSAPPPSPNNGLPANFPLGFNRPATPQKRASLWGMSAPTPPTNQNSGLVPSRGYNG